MGGFYGKCDEHVVTESIIMFLLMTKIICQTVLWLITF